MVIIYHGDLYFNQFSRVLSIEMVMFYFIQIEEGIIEITYSGTKLRISEPSVILEF